MKVIPNCISFTRIILSLILIFIKPLSTFFLIAYIICGISDIMDGYIARKTGTTSKLGAKLDSLADLIMVGVLLVVLYPVVSLSKEVVTWIIVIAVIRVISMIVTLIKYKTFAILHTYGNKFTGIVLFIFPVFISYTHINILMYIICTVASISAIEELIIQITSNELLVNRKGIFVK